MSTTVVFVLQVSAQKPNNDLKTPTVTTKKPANHLKAPKKSLSVFVVALTEKSINKWRRLWEARHISHD